MSDQTTIGFTYLTEPPKQTDWEALKAQGPSLMTKWHHLRVSLKKLVKSGFKRVPKPIVKYRLGVCKRCQHWKPGGNLGLGECNACGCSFLKALYSSMACPLKYWEEYHE